jgi:uncharacterized short protein YbdD (DUF466 family)
MTGNKETTEMKRRWAMSVKTGTDRTAGIVGLTSIAIGARRMCQSLRLMVGVPEYDTYVAHMRDKHPHLPVMSYQQFFRERQEARYGGKVSRCC